MKNLVLNRTYFDDATIGVLSINGQSNPVWHTIEKPYLHNTFEISCIPEGEYNVEPYSSDRFPDVWEIKDVPNRTHILFHVANWQTQLLGCNAPGLSAGYMIQDGVNRKSVSNSRLAMADMKKLLGYPSSFKLNIKS